MSPEFRLKIKTNILKTSFYLAENVLFDSFKLFFKPASTSLDYLHVIS